MAKWKTGWRQKAAGLALQQSKQTTKETAFLLALISTIGVLILIDIIARGAL